MRRRQLERDLATRHVATSDEETLRRALALDEFTVQYQPVVRRTDGEVVGLEALLRWQLRDGRLLPAREFVSSATRFGLISQVDHRMMGVVAQAPVRSALPSGLEWISINVAPSSLKDPEVTGRIVELTRELRRFGLDLVVEVSEKATAATLVGMAVTLDSFRRSGIRVALDDFGEKPLLLHRLLHFPVDIVKINGRRPLVEASRLRDQRGYARALVVLCRSLGRTVVVEQVETPPRRADSPISEADLVQGRFFGDAEFLPVRG